ncbi:hypothetical protein PPYR_00036 [Photinus pyralis]|uniref:Myb/SANT-like DNA-binding domain-containing protein n=1 Tax=Photinus pyralis TaxID=7054 RepID=A0A5N4B0H1_PHOPY|nr:uncharacterized protein LOC116159464 [Photinus pyralis]XP_031333952.1 uncharacterized protein LOC116163966 [Photinus pyralis]XP_031358505.1 uncharacterized protein LOC116182147 [Photinus pyralis]KAB0802690.1 hypothetical protein PPYR_04876 [Photinus pyralis]KAB0803066.1 hypothetical protein PPYR_00036 [Photinus pyralis]
MAVSTEVKELILVDNENKEYTVLLSSQDHARALNDLTFASALLRHAICNQKVNKTPSASPNVVNICQPGTSINPTPNVVDENQELPNDENQPLSPLSDNSDNSEEYLGRWPHEAILLLLDTYYEKCDQLLRGKVKPKPFWDDIARIINSHGYKVSGTQCRTKLATLKRQYKKIKDHNNASGNERREWIYTEKMDELFSNKPWVEPVATASSDGGKENVFQSTSFSTPEPVQSPLPQNVKSKRVVDLLAKIREDRQRHHDERMSQRSEAMELLRSLVDSVKKNPD